MLRVCILPDGRSLPTSLQAAEATLILQSSYSLSSAFIRQCDSSQEDETRHFTTPGEQAYSIQCIRDYLEAMALRDHELAC